MTNMEPFEARSKKDSETDVDSVDVHLHEWKFTIKNQAGYHAMMYIWGMVEW